MLAIANPGKEWPLLARALGHEDWLEDARFATPEARLANAAVLTRLLEEVFVREPWAHWRGVLSDANVTFGVVARTTDHAGDPQVNANGLMPEFVDAPGLKTVDSPFQVAGEVKNGPWMAPEIGQHGREILEEFGIDATGLQAFGGATE